MRASVVFGALLRGEDGSLHLIVRRWSAGRPPPVCHPVSVLISERAARLTPEASTSLESELCHVALRLSRLFSARAGPRRISPDFVSTSSFYHQHFSGPTVKENIGSSGTMALNHYTEDFKGPQTFTRSTSENSAPSMRMARLEHVDSDGEALYHMGKLWKNGRIVLQPAPSADPKDPLNLPFWRKFVAIFVLCFFGAMAAAAELILGAMLPIFVLYYAGYDPKYIKVLSDSGGLPKGTDPLKTLSMLPDAPPIWHVYLLASLPVLMMGVSNLFLVPIAIAVGRRSVTLATGVLAICGILWAGYSGSLASHIAARCLQALGAGTVESLLPFIVQDMVFVHQRNTAISGVFAAQVR